MKPNPKLRPFLRPDPGAGEISPDTRRDRGPIPLSREGRRTAKYLRFHKGLEFQEIARVLKVRQNAVRHALANARNEIPMEDRKRATVAISMAAYIELIRRQRRDEPMWGVINRVMGI